MIVGNKIDLPNRSVERDIAKKFAKQQRGEQKSEVISYGRQKTNFSALFGNKLCQIY